MGGVVWSELYPLVAVAVVAIGLVVWFIRIKTRQESHEDLCAERYAAIEARHAQLVKVSDERHRENRERLAGMDDKLDRLLER